LTGKNPYSILAAWARSATPNCGKAAVLLSAEDHASIEETLYLMSSARNAARLSEAIEGLRGGQAKERDLIECRSVFIGWPGRITSTGSTPIPDVFQESTI